MNGFTPGFSRNDESTLVLSFLRMFVSCALLPFTLVLLFQEMVYDQALAVIARHEAISLFMLPSLGGTKQSAVSVL